MLRANWIGLFLIGMQAVPASAATLGEIGLSFGGMKSEGDFDRFADYGLHFQGHLSLRMPQARSVALWIDGNYTEFNTTSAPDRYRLWTGEMVAATRKVKHWSSSLHVGPQIGSPTQRGLLRPRAGIGLGWYVFVIDHEIELEDREETFQPQKGPNKTWLGRFGWRANLALDVFPRREVGFSAQLLYDHVWGLDLATAAGEVTPNVQYWGVTLGIVVPLQHLDEFSKPEESPDG